MNINKCVNCMGDMENVSGTICPRCHFDNAKAADAQSPYAIRQNTILHGRYLIGNVLGQGGFGITYIGFDLLLSIKVAVKEYFPMGMVTRDPGKTNTLLWNINQVNTEQRQNGQESFLKEARRIAKIDQIPSIVRVRDTFFENETAYIVMDFVDGVTLKDKLLKNGSMSFTECMCYLVPIMEGLTQVHRVGIIHRDISPDNIIVQADGSVKLLDLGAAKDISMGQGQQSSLVAKSGFSPLEQYTEAGQIGPWTDVYALCATIYYCVTGQMVPNALDRIGSDGITFPDGMKEPLTTQVKAALEAGLAVEAKNRIQSVDELLTRLRVENPQPGPQEEKVNYQKNAPAGEDGLKEHKSLKWKLWIGAAAVVFIGIAAVVIAVGGREEGDFPTPTISPTPSTVDGSGEQLETETEAEEEMETEVNYVWELPVAHEEDFLYEVEEDGEGVVVTGYTGNMTSFQIPEKIAGKPIAVIGKDAFRGSALEEIVLPDGVQRIEDTAFAFCRKLHFVGLPEGLRDIGYGAFSDCGSLSEIEFPESLVNILSFAFHYTSLSKVHIPANVTAIEHGAFSVAPNAGFTEFTVSSENRFYEVYGGALYRRRLNSSDEPLPGELETLVAVPAGTTGYLAIPNGVTRIESYAFGYCMGVTSLYVPESVTSINESSFSGATIGKLTVSEECQLPDDSNFALDINRYADYSWGLPAAAEQDFQYEEEEGGAGVVITGYTGSMASFEIPGELAGKPVVAIGKDAFNSSAVKEVGLPKGLRKIGDGAFFACFELRFIGLPEGLEDIGGDAFSYCGNLTKIDLPESLMTIRGAAFSNTSLARIHIPANVENIEGAAFAVAFEAGFTQFTISDNNRFFKVNEGILYERQRDSSGKPISGGSEYLVAVPSGLTGPLVIPDNVTGLYAFVFYNCRGLTEVYVPEGVREISEWCFYQNAAIGELTVSEECQLPEDTSFASAIKRY